MNIPMERIAVLSIGTGTAVADLRKGVLKEGKRGWGMLEWILPNQGNIVTTIMDGTAEAGQAIVEVLFRVGLYLCLPLCPSPGELSEAFVSCCHSENHFRVGATCASTNLTKKLRFNVYKFVKY